jgi:hypothetical protein
MIHVELPPFRGPHSPLDLIVIKIIFGHIFEEFRRISQAAAAGTTSTADDKPSKRSRQSPLRQVLALR